jgi:hypothetical protein
VVVAVGDGVAVWTIVAVGVGATDGVADAMPVRVGVLVDSGTGALGVRVGVRVATDVPVCVDEGTPVAVLVGDGVTVAVGVGAATSKPPPQNPPPTT